MNITFLHNGASHEVTYPGSMSGHVKLYAVPTAYSPDGYYIALWQDGELEPLPGCAANDATLLCHARIERNESGNVSMKTLHTNNGANCHA